MIRVPFGFVVAISFIVSLPNILKPPAEIALIACWILHHFTPHAGDHIVSANTIYGGTYNLLAHTLKPFGITTTFVDADVEGSFENAIQANTKAIFIETLGNPNSSIIDIDAVAAIAHKHGIPLIVDNTFATPYLLRPIEHDKWKPT